MLGFVVFLLSLFAPILTVPFAIRGKYPSILLTPDDTVSPFGQYEETVRKVYGRFGKVVGDWYWLGVRNRLMGLSYRLKPAGLKGLSDYSSLDIERLGNTVVLKLDGKIYKEKNTRIGPFTLISGWRLTPIYNTIREGNPVRAINMDGRPIFSIRRKS